MENTSERSFVRSRRPRSASLSLAIAALAASATGNSWAETPSIRKAPAAKPVLREAISREMTIVGLERSRIRTVAAVPKANPGEIVSTVIPPGKTAVCPEGRLLISDDSMKGPLRVVSLALDDLDGASMEASFPPAATRVAAQRRIQSNDQELVTLKDGSVLLMRMAQAKTPLADPPIWFEHAYKLGASGPTYGPGARSEVLVYRSTDCGGTFHLASTIDTASIENLGIADAEDYPGGLAGAGGLPQRCGDADVCPHELPSGLTAWQMGGTDGPLMTVDPVSGRVFLSLWIVGNLPAKGVADFDLSGPRMNRTVVMMSSDGGGHWERAALLPYREWRAEVLPLEDDALAFGLLESDGGNVSFVQRTTIGSFTASGLSALQGAKKHCGAEPQKYWASADVSGTDLDGNRLAGLRGQTMLVRTANDGEGLLLVMDTEGGQANGKKGFRLFTVDLASQDCVAELPPILPTDAGASSHVYNPVLVHTGKGPTLAYWYDVTTDASDPAKPQSVAVRGRLVWGSSRYSSDFTIRGSFDVTADEWWGHYQMAGGYFAQTQLDDRAVFFPVWVEPDGGMHFRRLEYRTKRNLAEIGKGIHLMPKRKPFGRIVNPEGPARPELEILEEEHRLQEGGEVRGGRKQLRR